MTRDDRLLAGLLAVSGILHFVVPKPYVAIVPRQLPYKRELVLLSGAAELGCATMVMLPEYRRLGGMLSFGVLLAVFPANVQMAADGWRNGSAPTWYKIALLLRLPLQIPPLRWAARAAHRERR